MDDYGIFNPQFIERLKGDWERVAAEMKRATAPLREEAERLYEDVFGTATKGPRTPLDAFDWQRVTDDYETQRERIERTIGDLTVVQRQTVTLNDPGSAAASFTVRVTLTDGTTWQARIPAAVVARTTDAELRLWALRLVGKNTP